MQPLGQGRKLGYQIRRSGQITVNHTGDDGDRQAGGAQPFYTVMSSGPQSGTSIVDTPHYAAATIAFVSATKKITDSANLLASVKTGDTIRIRGSGSNDGAYTVATGNVAGEIVTTEALVNENAGAYITLCKRTAPSNNMVYDELTKLYWRRYTTKAEKVGAASGGKLAWYDATLCYMLHPAAADLAMNAANKTLKIVGGAAEAPKFWSGQLLEFAGFATGGAGKTNNRPGGFRVVSVTVNGADLDIVLWTGFVVTPMVLTGTTTNGNKIIAGLASTTGLRIGMAISGSGVGAASVIATIDSATQVTGTVNSTSSGTVSVTFTTLATEAAGGSRSIKVVCQTMFAYIAACNVAGVGGYSDWRAPYDAEMVAIRDMEQPTAAPNAAAFPSWPTDDYVWSATTIPPNASYAMVVLFDGGYMTYGFKATPYYVALLRGA